jgi:hypothetical protein
LTSPSWVAQGEIGDLASKKGNRNTHNSRNKACDSTGESWSAGKARIDLYTVLYHEPNIEYRHAATISDA